MATVKESLVDKIGIEERLDTEPLFDLIEDMRSERVLSNEKANLIEQILNLSEDDSVLANRAISRGADPFAIQYLSTGEVAEHVRSAHYQGPGHLEGEEREDWLLLASLSVDEHGEPLSLSDKLNQLVGASTLYSGGLSVEARASRIAAMRAKISQYPFEVKEVGGREMRNYKGADLGFAAAYWDGEDCASVTQPDGITFVGCKSHTTLEELGVTVQKVLSPQFGIIFLL